MRNGNVASADDWRSVLEPVVARYRTRKIKKLFRGDAGFANPQVYEFLEAEGYLYTIRLPANPVLQREIQHLMTRPVGRPPQKPIVLYHDFAYQAATWDKARRVVATGTDGKVHENDPPLKSPQQGHESARVSANRRNESHRDGGDGETHKHLRNAKKCDSARRNATQRERAGDRIRTGDVQLGKLTFYH